MKPVRHFDSNKKDINDILESFQEMGFGARSLGKAFSISKDMIKDKNCTVFVGASGALVPAGLKRCLIDFTKWSDVMVTTGANLTHDLIEAFGCSHHICEEYDDSKLREKGINRIYDVSMPNKAYEVLEKNLQPILRELSDRKSSRPYSIKEFLYEIGKRIESKDSILRACYENSVDLYCPALQDSGVGLQLWNFLQENDLTVDAFRDMKDIISRAWDSDKAGAIILGGGVPKNFILQSLQATPKDLSYAVQISTDRPEPGGLSGAPLHEGISWGKLGPKARRTNVFSDATIALPLLTSALKQEL